MDFQELLNRIAMIKADKYDIKIPVSALANLIMAGAMDSMFPTTPDLKTRLQAIEALKKTAKSDASLSNAKNPKVDINNIKNEFSRMRWLKNTNPLFTFRMYEYYKCAILSMQNYKPMQKSGMVYVKSNEDGWLTWIFKSWNICLKPDVIQTINRINTDHNQINKIAVGFVCVLDSYVIKKNKDYGDICEVSFDDGQGVFTGVVWSDRETNKTPAKMLASIKDLVGKPCIAIGKLSIKQRIGFNLLKLQELLT